MFVTVFCLLLNTDTGEVEFCNGGHNPPLVCDSKGCFEFVNVPTGFVVGAIENMVCTAKTLTLKPGDLFFLYTDGVTEAMNRTNQQFSDRKLKESLEKIKGTKEITGIIKGVREDVLGFAEGAAQSDDITMLVLRYNGKGA